MKLPALALAASLIAAPACAQVVHLGSVEIDTVGCREQADAFRFVELMAAGDKVAAARFFASKRPDCLLMRGGSSVHIERESAARFNMTCVRPKGEPDCRWIATGLVVRK